MDQVNAFETTLASVLRCADSQVDVLVVLSGDYADPHQILDEVRAVVVDSRGLPSLLGRVALAASAATSPWVMWLAPGVELTESALRESLDLIKRRDLGLVSPRILDLPSGSVPSGSVASSEASVRCLASSVALSNRYHPLYLEEILGEQWSEAEAMSEPLIYGPTGWAGLCQRSLMEQWALTVAPRLPQGYAELGLGMFVRRQGWEHTWTANGLLAGETVRVEVERGFAGCGRASNRILGWWQADNGISGVGRAIRVGLAELVRGFLSPSHFRLAWHRFQSLGLIRQALRGGTSSSLDVAVAAQPRDAQLRESPAGDSPADRAIRRTRSAA
jgi:hypothetical protein